MEEDHMKSFGGGGVRQVVPWWTCRLLPSAESTDQGASGIRLVAGPSSCALSIRV